jgi:nucleoside-triphosphatase THEP1
VSVGLKTLASFIIVCHNHPSGSLKPSNQDLVITNSLREACETVAITLLDHIIITKSGYYSFMENRQLNGLSKSQIYISKFLSLDGKVVSKAQVEKLTKALQADIRSSRINAKDRFAEEVILIQNKLVDLYNRMKSETKVQLTEETVRMLKQAFKPIAPKPRPIKKPETDPVRRHSQPAAKKQHSNVLNGFTAANQTPEKAKNVFRLPGPIGQLLQDMQTFKYAITLTGDYGAGKTTFVYQLIDAFAAAGKEVGVFSLEQGGMESKDTVNLVNKYIKPQNRPKVKITGEADQGIETVRSLANQFDVLVIDSWGKLEADIKQFDKLRSDFPQTIFVVIFQKNSQGTARGGPAAEFDGSVVLDAVKVDNSFVNNYILPRKNRGNTTNVHYNIASQETREGAYEAWLSTQLGG